MGGGVCALLGILWEDLFPDSTVYVYGSPCVVPLEVSDGLAGSGGARIISVIAEDDPFSCLSLGHVADISSALSALCDDGDLRQEILRKTMRPPNRMSEHDLDWCSQVMTKLREEHMSGEKLYPPGRILLLRSVPTTGNKVLGLWRRRHHKHQLLEVPPEYFRDLLIRPRMFDLTVHVPVKYVSSLRRLADGNNVRSY